MSSSRTNRTSLLRAGLDTPLANYYLIIVASSLLITLGAMMVLSASSVYAENNVGDAYYFFKRQLVFLVVGIGAAAVLASCRPDTLRKLAWVALLGSLALLILTHSPLGEEIQGNRNWVRFGPVQLQPAEFAKLAIVLWGADVLERKEKVLDEPRHLLFPFLPGAGLLIALVLLQRDLGTALVLMLITVGVLWMVGASWRILAALALGGLAGIVAMVMASPNRMARFVAFLNPGEELLGRNMQPTMALYALASGGWWGSGLGASRQKWGSLREAHTDYIFAIIGEELGLVGTIATIALLVVLGFAGFRCAMHSDRLFTRIVAGGATLWLTGQALMNIAVVLRLIPVMGVPLPFISYGGSALLANLLAVGALLSCARDEPSARRVLRKRRHSSARMTAVVGR